MATVPKKKATKKAAPKAAPMAAKKAPKKKAALKAPPVIEVSEEELASMKGAATRLGTQLQGTGTDEKALRAKEGRVYYIQCKECSNPGIWIFQRPAGELDTANWEAAYKPRNAGWPGSRLDCQVCGYALPIGVSHNGQKPFFMANYTRRYIRSIPVAQYEALKRGEALQNADVREVAL